ncbi:MAG: RteC domain-containing protein [Niastella sp.]|uniref:RteC domain-containing protein n=1 Tax=Niastella sp. TaxID=1869183 RepID=UPI00389A7BEA
MTNQLCLQQQCGRLYKRMLQQLAGYETTIIDEKKWIEWGFGLTAKTWFGIQQEADNYVFDDQQEEITFFKVLKPRFIALIDYFTLLYKSALFQPLDPDGNLEYWQHERATCKKFLSKHQSFCRYYEQGKTSMDHIYFVQENNHQSIIFGVNENRGNLSTSNSYLLARVLSIKKYYRYILEKINFLTNAAN